MKPTKTRFLPRIEALEDRTVPATYRLISGTLFVTNQTGDLTITGVTGTSVQVQDGAGPLLTFTGIGNVNVTGTNLANKITFNTTAQFNGNFFVNGGNGNDTVEVSGGKLLGNITAMGGLGNDSFTFNQAGNTIGGNVGYSDTAGNDTLNFNGSILGSTTATGGNTINIGGGAAFNLAGNATFTNTGDGFPVVATVDGGGTGTFGKSLSFTTGSGADTVTFAAADTVGGTTNINLGHGANAFAATDTVFNGSFSFTGGVGIDDVALNGVVKFNGNATVNTGDGDNTYALTSAFEAAGSFNLTAGNGNNAIGDFGGAVAGDLNVTLGNGTNSFNLTGSTGGNLNFQLGNGDNTLSDDATATIAGKLRIRSGNGNNSYTANGVGTYNLDVVFGSGDDTFTYAGAGAVLNGLLDGGGRVTANSFVQGAATLSPTLVIANFP
jgi:hypothetical protein